ncbi:MAG TPA: RdgB/HAM1 family non-canonical purine NTP pyrophosphatase [Terriglobia bacterium]|nr:RdgB/HAM1 family non-canonical purine NTP pyrophosphatase [Terriglobia bacterium]
MARSLADSPCSSLVPRRSPLVLYLASTNPGKLREFGEAARACGVRLEPAPGVANLPPCLEDGETFEANARKKALHYAASAPGLVFADDSGLCVDALGGAPGVHSARYAGMGANAADSDAANNSKLLAELRGVPHARRTAHYVCVIALAEGDRILTVVEGRATGVILEAPRGSGGFGYDPYFFYPPLGRTFAELSAAEKLKVSHRGEAFRKLLRWLERTRQAPRARHESAR